VTKNCYKVLVKTIRLILMELLKVALVLFVIHTVQKMNSDYRQCNYTCLADNVTAIQNMLHTDFEVFHYLLIFTLFLFNVWSLAKHL